MALRCHHVGCEDGEYWDGNCEYEQETYRLLHWISIPYEKMFERIDEEQALGMLRVILRCYKGAAAVR